MDPELGFCIFGPVPADPGSWQDARQALDPVFAFAR